MQNPRRKPPRLPAAGLLDPTNLAKHFSSFLPKPTKLPLFLTVAGIFFLAIFIYSEDLKSLAELSLSRLSQQDFAYFYKPRPYHHHRIRIRPPENGTGRHVAVHVPDTCDLSVGKWVFDNETYPIYYEEECSFLTEQVTCMRNGRRDETFQQWRWQPNDCSLPMFDPVLLLETLRNKRLMFVGDSLNRNQWESMVCMVQSELSPFKKRKTEVGSRTIFHAKEYNTTIEFYWAPFLVESNSDNPKIHSIAQRIIKAESIERHAVYWKNVDYLIFNTYIWWMNTPKMKIRRENASDWSEHDEVIRIEAYRRVLKTWSDWITQNIDPARTSLFFMSMSPLHISPRHWGNPDGIKCAKETLPVLNFTDRMYVGSDMQMFDLVQNVTRSMSRVPVTYIDITRMSEYRKDAHTSVYTIRQGKLLTREQKADPQTYADCIHWCLPGVPDIWNQILYTKILSKPAQS